MILNSLLAATASIAFSILFNVRGRNILLSGLCGGMGFFVYELVGSGNNVALFCAGMTITLLSETIARRAKTPAILFLVGGLLPLVPGREMFRMFMAVMEGRQATAMGHFWNTLLQAGSLAVGAIMVGAMLHIVSLVRKTEKT